MPTTLGMRPHELARIQAGLHWRQRQATAKTSGKPSCRAAVTALRPWPLESLASPHRRPREHPCLPMALQFPAPALGQLSAWHGVVRPDRGLPPLPTWYHVAGPRPQGSPMSSRPGSPALCCDLPASAMLLRPGTATPWQRDTTAGSSGQQQVSDSHRDSHRTVCKSAARLLPIFRYSLCGWLAFLLLEPRGLPPALGWRWEGVQDDSVLPDLHPVGPTEAG